MKKTLKKFLIPEEVPGKTNIGHPFETHDPIYGLPRKRTLKNETTTAAKITDTTKRKNK